MLKITMHDQAVLNAVIGIWALLVVASLAVFAIIKLNPDKNYKELSSRTRSWWVIMAVFTFAILSGRTMAICLFAFVSFLALKEFFSIIPTRRADRRVLFWAYLSIPFQYYWVADVWYGMFIVFIPVFMFIAIAQRMIITQHTKGFLKAAGTIHWGLMTTVFAISHAAYLLVLPALDGKSPGGGGLLLFLIFLTQLNDVAQYITGKLFGRRKILPGVSPNKTWGGFLGGTVTTTICAVIIAPFLTPFSFDRAFEAGIIIGIAGFFGDATISAVKRDIGVKDMGATIPGHGGIMDRIDSLTFTAPLFFYFTCYLYGY